ncbi:MAG: MlaD family protein [Chthoniobacterales bacterium]|nr:MlaD family protein [Chthoniobacterales bacterium]
MDSSHYSTQLRAGIFLFVGLVAIFSLVLYFGRFSEYSGHYYPITVEYSNANGLLKGADVLLAGARIGNIDKAPTVLPNMTGVAVVLKIEANVHIPKESIFSIGSSGLLGDRFVTVTIKEDANLTDTLAPKSIVQGQRESSLADLQQEMGTIIPKIDRVVSNVDTITERLKNDLFTKKGITEMKETLSNIHETSVLLANSSQQVQGIVNKTSSFLNKGNNAMASANGAMEDLKAFIRNLRLHGVIFYRDTAKGSR